MEFDLGEKGRFEITCRRVVAFTVESSRLLWDGTLDLQGANGSLSFFWDQPTTEAYKELKRWGLKVPENLMIQAMQEQGKRDKEAYRKANDDMARAMMEADAAKRLESRNA